MTRTPSNLFAQAFAQDQAARNFEKKLLKDRVPYGSPCLRHPMSEHWSEHPRLSDPSSSPPSSAAPGVSGAAGAAVPKVARPALPKAKAMELVELGTRQLVLLVAHEATLRGRTAGAQIGGEPGP